VDMPRSQFCNLGTSSGYAGFTATAGAPKFSLSTIEVKPICDFIEDFTIFEYPCELSATNLCQICIGVNFKRTKEIFVVASFDTKPYVNFIGPIDLHPIELQFNQTFNEPIV